MVDKRQKLLNEAVKKRLRTRVDVLRAAVDVGEGEIAKIESQLESGDFSSKRRRATKAVMERDVAEYKEAIAGLQKDIDKIVLPRRIAEAERGLEDLASRISMRNEDTPDDNVGGVDRRLGGMMRQTRNTCSTLAIRNLVLMTDLIYYLRPYEMARFEGILHGRTRCGSWRNMADVLEQYLYVESGWFSFNRTLWFDEEGATALLQVMNQLDINYGLLIVETLNGGGDHAIAFGRVNGSLQILDSNYPHLDTNTLLRTAPYGRLISVAGIRPYGPRQQPSAEIIRQSEILRSQARSAAYGRRVDDIVDEPDPDISSDEEIPPLPNVENIPSTQNEATSPSTEEDEDMERILGRPPTPGGRPSFKRVFRGKKVLNVGAKVAASLAAAGLTVAAVAQIPPEGHIEINAMQDYMRKNPGASLSDYAKTAAGNTTNVSYKRYMTGSWKTYWKIATVLKPFKIKMSPRIAFFLQRLRWK